MIQLSALDESDVPFGDELAVRAQAKDILNFWKKFLCLRKVQGLRVRVVRMSKR
jgi:hypothetical protein